MSRLAKEAGEAPFQVGDMVCMQTVVAGPVRVSGLRLMDTWARVPSEYEGIVLSYAKEPKTWHFAYGDARGNYCSRWIPCEKAALVEP